VDPRTHKRYLDYRERHAYFGRRQKLLSMDEFEKAETELTALESKGERRDDDEEARYVELCRDLLKD
jgi:hypothetical protein